VVNHVSGSGVSKTNKIIIQDFNINWFNYHYDLLLESTLDRIVCFEANGGFFPTVFVCDYLRCCPAALFYYWGPYREGWVYPTCQRRDSFIGNI
jgi:hypothetical protein